MKIWSRKSKKLSIQRKSNDCSGLMIKDLRAMELVGSDGCTSSVEDKPVFDFQARRQQAKLVKAEITPYDRGPILRKTFVWSFEVLSFDVEQRWLGAGRILINSKMTDYTSPVLPCKNGLKMKKLRNLTWSEKLLVSCSRNVEINNFTFDHECSGRAEEVVLWT